jgi:phosphoglycerate kinase
VIRDAGTVFWNGPDGRLRAGAVRRGTRTVAEAVAESDAVSVVGRRRLRRGDEEFGLADRVTHLSTGGGAAWS